MANTLIKDLTAKTTVVASDELPINDVAGGNLDKKEGMDDIKTFMSLSPTLVTPASLGVQQQDLDLNGNNLDKCGVAYLIEQAAADADIPGSGQHWVKTASPNIPMFTDDAGTDFDMASKTGTQAAIETIIIAASDETTLLETGQNKVTFHMPYNFTLTDIFATLTTAATDATFIADVHDDGTTIMTTDKLDIETGEFSTRTAGTAPALTTTVIAVNSVMTVDIDTIGSTLAGKGLKVYLIGYQT